MIPTWTVASAVQWGAQQLAPTSSARLDAELLLAWCLQSDRVGLIRERDQALGARITAQFADLITTRKTGRPVAYLVGRQEFWSCKFLVNEAVLIPRPETERLVELALRHCANASHTWIADLGTGSGAIACALAQERPYANVLATDRSRAALAVGHANACALGLKNIHFAQFHWLSGLAPAHYDLIVANPPYVAAEDYLTLDAAVRHEPRAALVSAQRGFADLEQIIDTARYHLRPQGWLLVEHGADQGRAVRRQLKAAGYDAIETWSDLAGLERVSGGAR